MADALAYVKVDLVVVKIADGTAPSATVTIKLRGTNTNASLFSDNVGTTTANPFSVANGRIECWVYEGSYDVVISGTGFATYTQEFEALHAQGLPPGLGPLPWPTNTPPLGWTICDGRLLDGTTALYSRLWSAIGTTYGGTGQSSFKLPDLRGMGPVGANNASLPNGTRASFVSSTDGGTKSLSTRNLGVTPGEETHTLSALESGVNQNGTATGNVSVSGSGSTNSNTTDISIQANTVAPGNVMYAGGGATVSGTSPFYNITNISSNHGHGVNDPGHNHTLSVNSSGSNSLPLGTRAADNAHNNMQPSQTFNFIIKL